MVSIITPTHRKGKYWEITVESVLQQTCTDFEWVVLDNSPDSYFEKDFNTFMESHPKYETVRKNVKIYKESFPLGTPVGRIKNRCVELCSCAYNDWVLVFDHDDIMASTTVADIIGCSNQYGERIQYIAGDNLFLEETKYGFLPSFVYNGDVVERTGQDIEIGEFKLATSKIQNKQLFRFGFDYGQYMILSHPRCIKRYLLDTIPFRFYEGLEYAEDVIQMRMAPLFLNTGWIDRYTVVYIHYGRTGSNMNSIHLQNEKQLAKTQSVENNLKNAYLSLRNVFGSDAKKEFFHYNSF